MTRPWESKSNTNNQGKNVSMWQSKSSTQQTQEQQTGSWESQSNNQQQQKQQTGHWESKFTNNNNRNENDSAWMNSRTTKMDQTEQQPNSNAWTSAATIPMIQGSWDEDQDEQNMENNTQPIEEELRVKQIWFNFVSFLKFLSRHFFGYQFCFN